MPDQQTLPSAPCLDPEVLAAYAEHQLTPEERASVEAHLADCGDCYVLLTEVMRTIDELDETSSGIGGTPAGPSSPSEPIVFRRSPGRRWLWGAGGGVLAAAAALILVVQVQPEWWWRLASGSDPRFAKLIEAVGTERTIEGRLSGGFKYGRLRSPTRSGTGEPFQNLSLLAAAGEIEQSVEKDPSPGNLHAWGVAQLLLGRTDSAVQTLEAAAAAVPNAANLQIDLAAAYAERGRVLNQPPDIIKALAVVERVLKATPTLREAAFNRALLLESTGLREQARAAWDHYLSLDRDSAWAEDARRRRDALAAGGG